VKYTDPDGEALETPWDIASAIFGAVCTGLSFANGDYFGVVVGGLGTIADGISAFVTGLPGGWSVGIKTIQYGTAAYSSLMNIAEGIKEKDEIKISIGVVQAIGMALGPMGSKYLQYADDAYKRAELIPRSMRYGMIMSGLKDEHVGQFLKAMSMLGISTETIIESYNTWIEYKKQNKNEVENANEN
jgi:hypothetical protein